MKSKDRFEFGPGVKKLIEATYRKGFQEGQKLIGAKYPKLFEDNFVFEYIKHLTEDGKNGGVS